MRDPRISANSLAALCDEIRESLEFSAMERIAAALANGDGAFPWERAADLLGVPVTQVQAWISAGKLRLVDTFVTDRSFEEFCKKHGEELKACLIDAATAKWMVTEYGASESATERRKRLARQKARVGDPNLQVWKEDNGKPILPAYQGLPGREHVRPPRRQLSVGKLFVEVNVRVGVSAPVLKRGVRVWQF